MEMGWVSSWVGLVWIEFAQKCSSLIGLGQVALVINSLLRRRAVIVLQTMWTLGRFMWDSVVIGVHWPMFVTLWLITSSWVSSNRRPLPLRAARLFVTYWSHNHADDRVMGCCDLLAYWLLLVRMGSAGASCLSWQIGGVTEITVPHI